MAGISLFYNKSWVYCPVLNAENIVLKWERLGAYSYVLIQIITMSKKEKKTFLTQHGTNEERQN